MSHAEAFGQLRSFVVGLEIKSRDLRKVLETSREDGKWVNGKDGTGVGERCARAIGAAQAEQVTQEMVAEVAEQDKLVRQAEEIVRTDQPVEEATEKYQALVEYNQLALEDLEQRLSAYGYVRPARVAVHHDKADLVRPPAVSSPARLPSGAAKTCGRSMTQDGGQTGSEGTSRGGRGGDVVSPGCSGAAATGGVKEAERAQVDSSCYPQQEQQQQQQQEQQRRRRRRREGEDDGGDEPGAGSASAAVVGTSDCAAGGDTSGGGDDEQADDPFPGDAASTEAHGPGRDENEREGSGEEEDIADDDGSASGFGVVTPARPALGVHANPQPEEEPDSPPTPESPGLADWEITEGAREMLRTAQPHHEEQEASSSTDGGSLAIAAAPRSLEALLAENTALSATGVCTDDGGGHRGGQGGGGGDRRSSVSSDWSPPPSTTGVMQQPRSSGGGRWRRGFVDGDDGRDGGCTGGAAVDGCSRSAECGDAETAPAAEIVAAIARGGSAGVETCSWGSSSNPPTPARMQFEREGPPLTPAGERSVANANGTDDRTSSLGTPSLGFRSPLKSDATADLLETALSFVERLDASATSERAGSTTHSVISTSKSSGAAPPTGGVLTGPQGDFWGAASSPESSVAAASRETTGEVPPPASPETPMLSPRFRVERGGAHGGSGGSANESRRAAGVTGAGSSERDTLSVSRRLPLTPTAAEAGDICAFTVNGDSGGGGGGGGSNKKGSSSGTNSEYEYDSDRCRTPELSSPLRSSNISVRDLQVLTPSAKANTSGGSGGGGGGISGGSACHRDGDDSDELYDSYQCPTPELSSPLRSADLPVGSVGSAALCRRRLYEASDGGPLQLVSEEEYARAPKFLTIQVSRSLLNETIENLNAYATPRLASPSELLLTVEEIMDIIDQGDLSRTLLLSAAHLKRVEMKGSRMYRIRA
ncbi:unnamed protein product [Scytosiphon promiscuus]